MKYGINKNPDIFVSCEKKFMSPKIFAKDNTELKTYVFEVCIEQDEDGRWAASCPALSGCATWGYTQEEALENIREAVEVYVEDLKVSGEPVRGAREVLAMPMVSVVAA